MSETEDFDSERFEQIYAELLERVQEIVEQHLYRSGSVGPTYYDANADIVYHWDGQKWVVGLDISEKPTTGGAMSEEDHISFHPDSPYRAVPELHNEVPSGAAKILIERHRVIFEEGYTPQHDAQHYPKDLTKAALCYLDYAHQQVRLGVNFSPVTNPPGLWPFEDEAWKPDEDPVRNLVKAGQFVAAAIDRVEAEANR